MSGEKISSGAIRVAPQDLNDFVRRCYENAGVATGDAEVIAGAITQTELRGVATHGAVRVPLYIQRLKEGGLNRSPTIALEQNFPASAVLDADHAPGHLGAMRGMELAIEKAKTCGVGVVSVKNSDHFGASSIYALRALKDDMIGMTWSNAFPIMAAWGGYGNNLTNGPLAYAIPTNRRPPIVLDISMAAIAMGRVRLAAKAGERLPPGLIVDKDGKPTDDPNALFDGGSTLPMGMHKGYGLSVIAEIFNGVLSGGPFLGDVILWSAQPAEHSRTSHFMLAIDVGKFRDIASFKDDVDSLIERLKAGPRMENQEEIMVPGELEARKTEEYERSGIPIASSVVNDLLVLADELGETVPESWRQ